MPVLVGDFALLLVGFHEDAGVADEMRIPFSEDQFHRLRVDEGHESEHPFLLVRNSHVLDRPVNASRHARREFFPVILDLNLLTS